MSPNQPEDAPPPHDAWLEDAVAAWRHQHRGCPDDAALVAYSQGDSSWPRHLALWWHVRRCALCRADVAALHEASATGAPDAPASPPQVLPRRLVLAGGALAGGLCLSLAFNIWLGVRLFEPAGSAGTSGRLQVAFADGVREQDLRALLLDLRATIIGGPSQEGLYTVQVPLPSPRRSGDPLRELLKELQDHPAVRLAEPASLPR